jgi:UDP-glucose 4-epimerase
LHHNVTVLDNLRNGNEKNLLNAKSFPGFRFIQGDILDKGDCNEALSGVEVVYHLACLGVRHSIHSPFENHQVNAEGTMNILEASLNNKLKHLFYISTSEIYGDIQQFPIDESGLPTPKTVYGASKLAGENYTIAFHKCYGLNATVLRIFNNYGPRSHFEGDAGEIIPRSIVKLLYGETPIIFGDGSVTRDFFYVKDTARALTELLNLEGLGGEIINIGTGVEICMNSVLESIIRIMGSHSKIKYMEVMGKSLKIFHLNTIQTLCEF